MTGPGDACNCGSDHLAARHLFGYCQVPGCPCVGFCPVDGEPEMPTPDSQVVAW